MRKIEVIIADDKPAYRKAITGILDLSAVRIIGEAGDGRELLSLLRQYEPHVVLLDLEMPVMDGNKAFELVHKHHPNVKVIILSSYIDSLLIEHYLQRGAKGYIPKDALSSELLTEALQQVIGGKTFIHEPLAGSLFTKRQKEIMPLIFEGLTNEEIAGEVNIGTRAIEKQRNKIYQQIGAKRAVDLYKYAFSRGLQFLGRSGR